LEEFRVTRFLALLRWALVIIFLWFGGMKFNAYEAAGIAPFIEHSPIMSWLHDLFEVQGASYVIGVIELSTAAALILGAFQPIFSALGAAMSAATYLITLTFFLSTPGVAEATAGGFPVISAAPGSSFLRTLFCWLHRFLSSLHLYRARGSTFRSHEMETLVYRSHLRRRACRREASIGCRPTAKTRRLGLIGSAEPMTDKWLGYPGRLYNRR
jgi:uncharacterized membrane protein YphA (DoxX/SURF4 family)